MFEAVTFGRKNHFDFQYLNPIIFLRPVESGNGSGDKAKVGFDFKANVANRFQFYGQFLFDEFVLGKLRNDKNNYVNKFGYQVGAKYVDAFGIPNLDLQGEINRVRPFTYSPVIQFLITHITTSLWLIHWVLTSRNLSVL